MAFNLDPNAQAPAQKDDSWKADAFLNLYLPGADGQPKKLGAIALHKRKKQDQQLIEALEGKKAEEILEFILENLTANYQQADGSGAAGFALPN